MSSYFVYILICHDQTLYIGYTTNLEKRLKAHNSGSQGAKYTRSRRPVRLVYCEEQSDLSAALKREYQLKQLSRKEKLVLIENNH